MRLRAEVESRRSFNEDRDHSSLRQAPVQLDGRANFIELPRSDKKRLESEGCCEGLPRSARPAISAETSPELPRQQAAQTIPQQQIGAMDQLQTFSEGGSSSSSVRAPSRRSSRSESARTHVLPASLVGLRARTVTHTAQQRMPKTRTAADAKEVFHPSAAAAECEPADPRQRLLQSRGHGVGPSNGPSHSQDLESSSHVPSVADGWVAEEIARLQEQQRRCCKEVRELREEVEGHLRSSHEASASSVAEALEEMRADMQQLRSQLEPKATEGSSVPSFVEGLPDYADFARLRSDVEALNNSCRGAVQRLEHRLDGLLLRQAQRDQSRSEGFPELPHEGSSKSSAGDESHFSLQLKVTALQTQVAHTLEVAMESRAAVEEDQAAMWSIMRTMQTLLESLGIVQHSSKHRSKSLTYEAQVLEVGMAQAAKLQHDGRLRAQVQSDAPRARDPGSSSSEDKSSNDGLHRQVIAVSSNAKIDGHADQTHALGTIRSVAMMAD
mmetsp:Transcript_8140/g.18169  ORF Transcript_8140/g.18169 Transcript_8140/m.18169 type:complete len:498 (-) Transcript_8140:29-1522(-)